MSINTIMTLVWVMLAVAYVFFGMRHMRRMRRAIERLYMLKPAPPDFHLRVLVSRKDIMQYKFQLAIGADAILTSALTLVFPPSEMRGVAIGIGVMAIMGILVLKTLIYERDIHRIIWSDADEK